MFIATKANFMSSSGRSDISPLTGLEPDPQRILYKYFVPSSLSERGFRQRKTNDLQTPRGFESPLTY